MTRKQPDINVLRYICWEVELCLSKKPLLKGISFESEGRGDLSSDGG
jgi:hypothetical protein